MLALTVALVGPYFVDWTSYRADFEREVGRILGREVKVEGSATARLLPFPSVTFTDVVVAGVEPGQPAMTVETFSMDAELAPFMRGDIHIFDMRLVRPSVVVDVAENGSLDWAVRPSVPVEARHISLEKLTITEGKVAIRHAASGRTHMLTEVNADISARSLAGPWRMDGSLRLDGMLTALSVSTGSVDGENGMRLRLRARPEIYPFELETDGNASIEGGSAHYAGTFRLAAALDAATGEATANDAPPAYRLNGAFDIDHTALHVDEFRFQTGPVEDPYTADGSAELALGKEPRFLIRADGAQIRFDAAAQGNETGIRLGERLAALREFMLDMPRPTIPGSVDVSLPAIVAGDTTIRDVRLSAGPSEAGWSIASLAATLPGRATLEAQGELAVDEELAFAGSLLLAVGQPSGFAAWLARDVDDAIRRLPAAGFNAKVELSPERQTFRDLELMLGDARFTGEIDSRTPPDERPSMALRLDGDRLDVEGMAAFASLFVSDSGEARLADRDLEFEITAGPVTAAGLTAQTLDTALRFKAGTLEIDRLSIEGLAGANVSATGSVKNIGSEPVGGLDAAIIAADLAPLVDTLARRFPGSVPVQALAQRAKNYPGLLENASLRLVASSTASVTEAATAALSATGEAGGTEFTLTASSEDIDGGLMQAPLALEFSARNGEAAALYGLAGLPALPLGLAGAADMKLSFDGTMADGGRTRFDFTGEDLDFGFDGSTALVGGTLAANGSLDMVSGNLEPWLAAAGVALPGFGLGLPARLSADLDLGDGLLVLSNLDGRIVDASVSGDINAQVVDGLPRLTGAMSLSTLDLASVAELVVGADALSGVEEGWPSAPFAQQVSSPFSAELDLAVETLHAGTFARASDARLRLRLGAEGVSLSNLNARMLGGVLTGIVDFRNDGGTGLLSSQLQLAGGDARQILGDTGLGAAVDIGASLTASGKSVDGLISALSGSGTARVDDLTVEGIDPHALPAILEAADSYGPQIDAAATTALASQRVRDGVFRANSVDIAFTLANGTLRAPPIRLETADAVLTSELRADLREGLVAADALLTYAAGADALAGSDPAVRFTASGPLDAIDIEVDTTPLAQFLTQRALEAEQQRVEAMQAGLLEGQRHRRETRYYAALAERREDAAREERREAEEAERLERELRQLEKGAQQRQSDDAARRAREEAELAAAQREVERLAAQEAQRQRASEERLAEEERQRAEDERLRAEVEALLRARDTATTAPDPATVPQEPQDTPVNPPAVVDVTPTPRPSGAAEPGSVPADAGLFSEQDLSGDGFMRMLLGETP